MAKRFMGEQNNCQWDGAALKRACLARLAGAPTDQVYSASHIPTRGDHDLNGGEVFDLGDEGRGDDEGGRGEDITDSESTARAPQTEPLKVPKPAAVLVPIIERAHGLSVLLTQRHKNLNSHGGQISFPGGKVDASDPSPLDTALRESYEEVGIRREHVEVLGYCDDYQTVTGFRIVPVVGLVSSETELVAEPGEVALIFEVPFDFLMCAENHRRDSLVWQGKRRHYFAMPYETHYIWGATAGILKNLHERLFI